MTSHNPKRYNQYSKKEFQHSKYNFSSPEVFQFSLGKSDLNSKRLSKKLKFATSPSKLSTKRHSELLKSKSMAIKALCCLVPFQSKKNQNKLCYGDKTVFPTFQFGYARTRRVESDTRHASLTFRSGHLTWKQKTCHKRSQLKKLQS